jgi:hypothetical protein
MSRPHPALLDLAAGRPMGRIDDFEELEKSAQEHRMIGLLSSSLLASESGAPPELLQRMGMFGLQNRLIQELNWKALREVVTRLEAIDIQVVTFKGVTAEARWYEQQGERPSSDVDVLVQPDAVGRAQEVIAALESENEMIPHIGKLVESGIAESLAVRLPDGVTVDVHFALLEVGLPLQQREEVWARTVGHAHPDGGSVRVLDPETALIHLLLHLNKDRFARLLWYADVARLLRVEQNLDWDYIDRFVRTEGLEAPFYLSLDAVLSDLGMENPYDTVPTGWRAVLWGRLWGQETRLAGEAGLEHRQHRQRFLSLMFKGRKRQALWWWFRKLFPPDPMLSWRYPWAKGPYAWRVALTRIPGAWNVIRSEWTSRRSR